MTISIIIIIIYVHVYIFDKFMRMLRGGFCQYDSRSWISLLCETSEEERNVAKQRYTSNDASSVVYSFYFAFAEFIQFYWMMVMKIRISKT